MTTTTADVTTYAATVDLRADLRIARWRPAVQWILAIPQLVITDLLGTLRCALTVVSLVTVVFTKRIPRSVFDAIAMTYRYEWRTLSYALAVHDEYPPFDFTPSASDDGAARNGALSLRYPTELGRWQPFYKWFLAIPHYPVCVALAVVGAVSVVFGLVAAIVTGRYPRRARDFVVGSYRYGLRVQAYVGLLTDQYPPFSFAR
jgi:hypothetical protein